MGAAHVKNKVMSDEIKSWVILHVLIALVCILCPNPMLLFHKASTFKYILFTFVILFNLSPFYKSAVKVFKENKGMTPWRYFKGLQYFYYFVLIFFIFDQLGYLFKLASS